MRADLAVGIMEEDSRTNGKPTDSERHGAKRPKPFRTINGKDHLWMKGTNVIEWQSRNIESERLPLRWKSMACRIQQNIRLCVIDRLRKTCGSGCMQDNSIQIVTPVVRVGVRDHGQVPSLLIKVEKSRCMDEFDVIISEK